MKKRIFALLLCGALSLSLLTACGGKDTGTPGTSGTPGTPGVQDPAFSVDLAEFYQSIMDAAVEAPMMMEMTGELLDGAYEGLSALDLKQCVVYSPAITATAIEFAFVEAADPADVETVKEIFQKRIDAQVDGGAWYPMTIEGWQNHSEIVVIDNYVCLFVCDEKDGMIQALRTGSDVPAWCEPPEGGDDDVETGGVVVDTPDESAPETTPTPAATPAPTPAPTPTPKPAPTPAPEVPDSVDLAAFAETVLGSYEFSFLELVDPDDEMGASLLANYYSGLTGLELKQSLLYLCMMSMNNGELALVETKNADDAAAAAAAFQARIDYMVGDGNGPGGAWYPEPTRIWSECSQVVVKGNYVMMVVHEQYSDIVDQFNALF